MATVRLSRFWGEHVLCKHSKRRCMRLCPTRVVGSPIPILVGRGDNGAGRGKVAAIMSCSHAYGSHAYGSHAGGADSEPDHACQHGDADGTFRSR
jgi:hypothetical protein